jgi:hypothetical protein
MSFLEDNPIIQKHPNSSKMPEEGRKERRNLKLKNRQCLL